MNVLLEIVWNCPSVEQTTYKCTNQSFIVTGPDVTTSVTIFSQSDNLYITQAVTQYWSDGLGQENLHFDH